MGSQRARHDWATYTSAPAWVEEFEEFWCITTLGEGFYSLSENQKILPCHFTEAPWGREELDTTERLHFHAREKEMATHSSVLAWRIPGTGEPGGLPSMGSQRVGQDWSDLAAALSPEALFHIPKELPSFWSSRCLWKQERLLNLQRT